MASQVGCGPKDKGSALQVKECGFPFWSILGSVHRVTSTCEKRQVAGQSCEDVPGRAGSWEQPQTLQETPERISAPCSHVDDPRTISCPLQKILSPLIHGANSPWLQLATCASSEPGNVTGTGSGSARSLENSTSPSPTTN